MWRLVQLLVLVASAACGEAAERVVKSGPARRIVSLSPALTATVASLGWQDRLVGCTPWCGMGERVPVVGSLLEVDLERLAMTQPDLVLVQRTASGPPPGLTQAARSHAWRVVEIPCTSLAEVRNLEAAVCQAVGEQAVSTDTAARWARALSPVEAVVAQSPATLLFAVDPPQAFGKDSYLAQIWSAWGGRCLPDASGHPSMRLEDLSAMPLRAIWVVGSAQGSAPALDALASKGVLVRCQAEPALLRPGPELLAAAERWRSALEAAGTP